MGAGAPRISDTGTAHTNSTLGSDRDLGRDRASDVANSKASGLTKTAKAKKAKKAKKSKHRQG